MIRSLFGYSTDEEVLRDHNSKLVRTISALRGWATRRDQEIATLKKDLVNQKMWFAAYVSKKEGRGCAGKQEIGRLG